MNKVEQWKAEKHGLDVWPNVLEFAEKSTPMKAIDDAELERMKWYGVFYRKRDGEGTYMLRIRLTANELTSSQAKEIAYLAYEYGYGIVDVTTRANLQVQGLAIESVPRALARLEAVGITAKQTGHDNIRNVFGHPLSGVDPDELFDTRPLCRDITHLFLGSRVYSDLPRKINIAMSGAAQHASHFWSQDISYLATETNDGEIAFQVLLAGTQGQNPHLAWHLPVLVRPEQVVPVTKAILDLFREQGSRERRDAARLRYLVERIGIGGVLAELEQRLDFPLAPCVSEPQPPSGYDDLVGWFRQKEQARWAMGLCVPLGRLSWQQLEGLGVLAKRWGSGNLRATPEQGLMVLDIPTGFKDAAATAAAALGLSPQADSLAMSTVACTGKQFCNIAVTETKGHMFQLIESLRKRAVTLHGIRIHMSGCPSSCAQHHTADIGLKGVRVRRIFGTCEGFDIYLGGGIAGQMHLGLIYKMGVDVHQLPLVIEDVIKQYYLKHRPGQTFSAYWREELKNQEAAKVGDGEYAPPTWLCENCNHRHLGEDPPVFCPSCAGLRRHFARLESEAVAADTNSFPGSAWERANPRLRLGAAARRSVSTIAWRLGLANNPGRETLDSGVTPCRAPAIDSTPKCAARTSSLARSWPGCRSLRGRSRRKSSSTPGLFFRRRGGSSYSGTSFWRTTCYSIAAADDLSHEVACFKSFTARRVLDLLELRGAHVLLEQLRYYKERHKLDQEYQLWQEGSHPEAINCDEMMWQKLEYAHNNPLKRGYVDEPTHWRYSSARNYAKQPGLIHVTTEW